MNDVLIISGVAIVWAIGFWIWRTRKKKEIKPEYQLKDVLGGTKIVITYWQQNVVVDCLNNNPADKEMFLRVYFEADVKRDKPAYHKDLVFPYKDEVFKHFKTLNVRGKFTQEKDKTKSTLEDEMQSALKEERFEEAAVLRDAINKLAEVNQKNNTKK
jgi:hypothetical protein